MGKSIKNNKDKLIMSYFNYIQKRRYDPDVQPPHHPFLCASREDVVFVYHQRTQLVVYRHAEQGLGKLHEIHIDCVTVLSAQMRPVDISVINNDYIAVLTNTRHLFIFQLFWKNKKFHLTYQTQNISY